MGRVRRWPRERLRRFVLEYENRCAHCPPYPLLEAARIELARRRGGGTLDWRCRVSGPDGGAVTVTVTLPVGLTATELHDAALAQVRPRHGPRAQVQVLAVDDGDPAPANPAAPTCRDGGRVHRPGCCRPARPALSDQRG
ncbi:hypothetical protein RAJCM14343_5235 [Rhodococcus aetherivorans]|uniref:Asp23/Gls24 family envelope stress response protein n=1 Tax=Rhodococcus aetherivorans TaxID=191292 RepID=A0ABQ0YTT9_9NOCA|nr:hypothetical protein RAJCM14343_5235 [Rhodococcus aetherivorans]